MKCCEACFNPHANPLKAFPRETSALGNCEGCETQGTYVWDATVLLDAFSTVLSQYERASDEGEPLPQALQSDWEIFAFDDHDRIQAFLESVFGGLNAIVSEAATVRLRRGDNDDGADHVGAWGRFADDLMYGNRYFPSSSANLPFLTTVVKSRERAVEPGFKFYRARVCDGPDGFDGEKMGMPPPELASAGRANPLGIPHLYLALDDETCIRESRAVQHNFVTVATFEATERIGVLDLNGYYPLNPFSIEDDAAARLAAARTIERLGQELQRPVRPTDNQVEYVPTQFLSGLAMSLGLDGILYASSLHPEGGNVVLFNDSKVEITESPETHEITSMRLERRRVG